MDEKKPSYGAEETTPDGERLAEAKSEYSEMLEAFMK